MGRHTGSRSFGGWKGFGLGIATTVLIDVVAPNLTKSAGPAARSALKFFFRLSDEVGRSAARTREQVEDFVASTRAEYEAEQAAAPPFNGAQPSPETTS